MSSIAPSNSVLQANEGSLRDGLPSLKSGGDSEININPSAGTLDFGDAGLSLEGGIEKSLSTELECCKRPEVTNIGQLGVSTSKNLTSERSQTQPVLISETSMAELRVNLSDPKSDGLSKSSLGDGFANDIFSTVAETSADFANSGLELGSSGALSLTVSDAPPVCCEVKAEVAKTTTVSNKEQRIQIEEVSVTRFKADKEEMRSSQQKNTDQTSSISLSVNEAKQPKTLAPTPTSQEKDLASQSVSKTRVTTSSRNPEVPRPTHSNKSTTTSETAKIKTNQPMRDGNISLNSGLQRIRLRSTELRNIVQPSQRNDQITNTARAVGKINKLGDIKPILHSQTSRNRITTNPRTTQSAIRSEIHATSVRSEKNIPLHGVVKYLSKLSTLLPTRRSQPSAVLSHRVSTPLVSKSRTGIISLIRERLASLLSTTNKRTTTKSARALYSKYEKSKAARNRGRQLDQKRAPKVVSQSGSKVKLRSSVSRQDSEATIQTKNIKRHERNQLLALRKLLEKAAPSQAKVVKISGLLRLVRSRAEISGRMRSKKDFPPKQQKILTDKSIVKTQRQAARLVIGLKRQLRELLGTRSPLAKRLLKRCTVHELLTFISIMKRMRAAPRSYSNYYKISSIRRKSSSRVKLRSKSRRFRYDEELIGYDFEQSSVLEHDALDASQNINTWNDQALELSVPAGAGLGESKIREELSASAQHGPTKNLLTKLNYEETDSEIEARKKYKKLQGF